MFQRGWESLVARRILGGALVVAFLGAVAVIELNRQGFLPAPFDRILTTNHFGALDLAFTFLLVIEVWGWSWRWRTRWPTPSASNSSSSP